jgi:hypothetical protein
VKITVPVEAQIWQLALANFGPQGVAERLRLAKQLFQRSRPVDSYVLLPVEQFGVEVLGVIRAVPELAQLDMDGRLLMPSRLRWYLFNVLLQAVPVERLSEPLLELRLQIDLGL